MTGTRTLEEGEETVWDLLGLTDRMRIMAMNEMGLRSYPLTPSIVARYQKGS